MDNMLDRNNKHLFLEKSKNRNNSFIVNVNKLIEKYDDLVDISTKFTEEDIELLTQLVKEEVDINIEVIADELWIKAVKTIPIINNKNGFLMLASKSTIVWFSFKNSIDSFINVKPTKIKPKPDKILPIVFIFSFLVNKLIKAPIPVKPIAIAIKSKVCNAAIWAVTVVPIFAPIIIVAAWPNVIIPALTRPITMTVVNPELWTKAVVAQPIPTPTSFLSDVFRNKALILELAIFSILSESILQPTKNTPKPANISNIK